MFIVYPIMSHTFIIIIPDTGTHRTVSHSQYQLTARRHYKRQLQNYSRK